MYFPFKNMVKVIKFKAKQKKADWNLLQSAHIS